MFPLRAKPEFYRQALFKILTRSQGQSEGFTQICAIAEKVEEAQVQALRRPLDEEEKRQLRLRTMRDIRISLLAMSAAIAGTKDMTDTHVRRTTNLPYLQWRIEKEILTLHWQCTLSDLDDRQVRSGTRMPRFLADAIEMEGLN